jgi:hypothetical protein
LIFGAYLFSDSLDYIKEFLQYPLILVIKFYKMNSNCN